MDNHEEELDIAPSTVSALQLKIDELKALANEATEREKSANERAEACLRRAEELLSLLDAKERENKSLREAIESLPTSANASTPERIRVSQDTAEIFPPTPAQLDPSRQTSHATFSNADLVINTPIGEADGAITPPSGNLETLDSRVESEVAHSLDRCYRCDRSLFSQEVFTETSPLPVITELDRSAVLSLIVAPSRIACEAQTRNEETQRDETEPEQLEVMNQPVSSSHERPSNGGSARKRRRLIKKHEEVEDEEPVLPALTLMQNSPNEEPVIALPWLQELPKTPEVYLSADESPPSTGNSKGKRKRGRRNSVQMASDDDEDYAPSPPSRKKLFNSLVIPNATPAHVILEKHGKAESPGREAIVGMEFGGGITVTEILRKDGKVTPECSLKRLRRVSGEVLAEVGRVTRSKRLSQSSDHLEEDEIESSDELPLVDTRVTPKRSLKRLRRNDSVESPPPGATQQVDRRRSQRLSQVSPMPTSELPEDEIESSDGDSFIVESSAESSESTKSSESAKISESTKSSESSEEDFIDLTGSDSESDPVVRRRSGRFAATQAQQSERSESPESSGQAPPEKAVNLLRPSPEDDEEEDDDDDDDEEMKGFITNESSSDTGDSEDDEPLPDENESSSDTGDSDDDEQLPDDVDSGSQINIREERVRRRQHKIWEFEGDMLTAVENSDDIALQALCAVYRQQTKDEQVAKDSLYRNGRGFDRMNVLRGSIYAAWLIDGDEAGQLKKSPQAFKRHFSGELGSLKAIAKHHSKQLFEIYTNNEDPYWRSLPDES